MYYFGPATLTKDYFMERLVDSPPPVVAVDSETISLTERMPVGFSIATSPDEAFYFETFPEPDPALHYLNKILTGPRFKKVFHNAPFDLRNIPLVVPIDMTNIADTAVMARLLGREDARLYLLAIEVGKETTPAKVLMDKFKAKTMLEMPVEEVAKHCAEDSRCTLALYHHYLPHIDSSYFAVEMEVIPILIDMGLRGVKFCEEDRAAIEKKLEADLDYYKNMIISQGVENPNSGQQIGFILAKRGNFLPLTKSKKQLKTDEDTLEFIDDPLAQVVLSYKQNNTLLTKYIWPLKGKDRVYTNYNLDARVGRISSSDMNLQNLPGKNPTRPRVVHYNIRNIITPDSGIYTTGDYSQEHLYIIMHLSGDRQMRRVYIEGEMDRDIHNFAAQMMFGTVNPQTRKIAKTINYAIAYGATAKTISQQARIPDIKKCSGFLDKWFATFREAAEWIKGAQREGIRDGWSLPTLFGRRIRLPEDEGEEGMKSKAINYPVQGSDGEVMKRALILCKKYNLPLALTVHDSITCLEPNTPVLRANLTWSPIRDIVVGDSLIGIDENKHNKYHRHLRLSIVEAKVEVEDIAYIVLFNNDEIVISSREHKWLSVNLKRRAYNSRAKTGWARTDALEVGSRIKYIGKPWSFDNSWESGYIAGLLDGEGSIGHSAINFTQNEGLVLDKYMSTLTKLGFVPHKYKHASSKVVNVSRLQENLKLLGITRPVRLLDNAASYWEDYVPQFDYITVAGIIKLPNPITLIDIKTSTKTFIANGLVSHNCDGDCEFPTEELENIAPVRIPFEVSKTLRWE